VDKRDITELLEAVASGKTSVAEAEERLRRMPFEDLGFARVDHHRGLRQGASEIVFGQGKTPAQVVAIIQSLVAAGSDVLATRVTAEQAKAAKKAVAGVTHDPISRTLVKKKRRKETTADRARPGVLIVAAGTSDLPVAEEAAVTAEFLGERVARLFDVGVSGLHRLLHASDKLADAGVIVVVAGMEGALASVVGGLVDKPVIACPTSIGYGASFGGLAALLAMLNSCANHVSVVNIDNGFGAACVASRILRVPSK
jgi:hypothetical protein